MPKLVKRRGRKYSVPNENVTPSQNQFIDQRDLGDAIWKHSKHQLNQAFYLLIRYSQNSKTVSFFGPAHMLPNSIDIATHFKQSEKYRGNITSEYRAYLIIKAFLMEIEDTQGQFNSVLQKISLILEYLILLSKDSIKRSQQNKKSLYLERQRRQQIQSSKYKLLLLQRNYFYERAFCRREYSFSDETMFALSTLAKIAFSSKGTNIELDELSFNTQSLALVATVSREKGLECWQIIDRSLNSDSFIEFLQLITQSNDPDHTVIFMDNCRVHHSRKVTAFLQEKKFTPAFNVAQSPQSKPIQLIWSIVMRHFKTAKLRALMDATIFKYRNFIQGSLDQVSNDVTKSYAKQSMESTQRDHQ